MSRYNGGMTHNTTTGKATKGPERIVAVDRDEHESCEAGTPGCCIDHSRDRHDSCETW